MKSRTRERISSLIRRGARAGHRTATAGRSIVCHELVADERRIRYGIWLLTIATSAVFSGVGCGGPPDERESPTRQVRQASALSDVLDKYLPPDVKTIALDADTVATIYTQSTAIDAIAKAVLTSIGFLQQAKSTEPTLTQISSQIRNVADSVSWLITTQDRENRLADVEADVNTVQESLNLAPFVANPDAISRSAELTKEAEEDTAFLRFADESVTDGETQWKNVILTRQPQVMDAAGQHSYVYDWRLGVPALLELVRLRLEVIGLIDPNFRQDHLFCTELTDYSTAIWLQGGRMERDVVCGTWDADPNAYFGFVVACADINSGAAIVQSIERPPSSGRSAPPTYRSNDPNQVCAPSWDDCTVCEDYGCHLDYSCAAAEGGFCRAWWDNTVIPLEDQMSSIIRSKMPLDEMNVFRNLLFSIGCPNGD